MNPVPTPTRGTALGPTAAAIVESLHQHRLLSTRQIHALHTPTASQRFTRRLLARLEQAGLTAATPTRGRLLIWHLTETGTAAAEAVPSRAETRHKIITATHAAGPLQRHTLAVNDVGIAFVQAARLRDDECGPLAWRHEIAHPLGPPPGRRTSDQLISDAVLTYESTNGQQTTDIAYRFIEVDRATRSTADLAARLARYARLHHHTTPAQPGQVPERLWRSLYPVFPAVLVAFAGASRSRLERRRRAVLALCRDDPDLAATPEVDISICLLDDLRIHGPFAPIFHKPGDPTMPTDWLGERT